ncbi:glycosyltransferase family 2 protein [Candidatus Methylopumilus rimovensis]|uniref:glycosyltransferase family 2 protein n=1 Tax=Candidatus Methylopumilus rimovensis TaxID=2588535 RepID=UPI00165278D7|nr:glycosyltransferase [Candidatus Methylopumilus rimovensis]
MTTFNRYEMLSDTLHSILNQSFNNFELIIVDNMSSDQTKHYISSLKDERIRYFRNPNFGVIAINRNLGILKAKGQYIAFCDDDDLWLETKLHIQIALLESDSEVAMCYSQAESFINGLTVKKNMNRKALWSSHFISLLQGNFIPNSSVVIKKTVFKKLGMLTESPCLREDYEMWLRVSKYFKIVGIQESLIKYRLHNNNIAGGKVAETKKAIKTLKSLVIPLRIPLYLYVPNLFFQYLKYFFYSIRSFFNSKQVNGSQ